MNRRPILLLVNPVAGGKPGSGPGLTDDPALLTADALREALQRRGLEVSHRQIAPDDDLADLASTAADTGHDVVVAGGDGTVGVVAAALIGHQDAALGILAMGSFNNIANGFGIPVTLEPALDVIAGGASKLFDAGWVVRDADEGRPFFEAAGIGLDAIGFLTAEVAERRGWWRAARTLLRGLRLRRTPVRISLDGTSYRTGTPAITVSNGPYHGPGLAVSADADPTDGLLDVAVFHGMSRLEVIGHFVAVARGRRRREPKIRQYRARHVAIQGARRALPAHADGEIIGLTPVEFDVRPAALRVFAPAEDVDG